ncbi:hypothetical protein HYU89_00605 [Candidatus Collierbacteria bacterium]|nr:hypothetical protein [Candidatus Collierbacteria bacterium]
MTNLAKIRNVDAAIKEVADIHFANKLVETFCVVGSYAKKNGVLSNDIDCLIIVKNHTQDDDLIHLVKSLPNSVPLEKSDDTYRTLISGIEFGLAYFESNDFYNSIIGGFIKGNAKSISIINRPWVIGGKIPEVLLGDIELSQIIFDRSIRKRFTHLKKTLSISYHPTLRKTLLKELRQEINIKLKLTERALMNRDWMLFEVGLTDVSIAIIRYVYAKDSQYMQPLKHIHHGYFHDLTVKRFRQIVKNVIDIFCLDSRNDKLLSVTNISKKILEGEDQK